MLHPSLRLTLIACALLLGMSLTAAQDVVGNNVPDALTVLAVTPDINTRSADPDHTTITVMFDRPVVPLNALTQPIGEPVISTYPEISGQGEWVHPAVYQFTPAEDALTGGVSYEVIVAAPLTAVDGSVMTSPFSWSFETIAPQVIEILPTLTHGNRALLDSGVRVLFSQAMDRESTERAYSFQRYIGPNCAEGCSNHPDDWEDVDGNIFWSEDSHRFVFKPTERLDYDVFWKTAYRSVLNTSAKNAAGLAAVHSPVTVPLHTVPRPAVSGISPTHREAVTPGVRQVTIGFMGAMNPETYRDRYVVSPTPPGEITPYVDDNDALRLEFNHEVDTDYTITILPGIEDIYGTSIEEEVSVTYRVREERSENMGFMEPVNGQTMIIAPTYLDRLAISWRVKEPTEYTASIYRASYDMLFHVAERRRSIGGTFSLQDFYNPNYYYWESFGTNPFVIPWVQDDLLVQRNTVTLTPEFENEDAASDGKTMSIPLQSPDDALLPMGVYGVDINETTGFVLAVANAGITVKSAAERLLVWVTDYETAEPVHGARVSVRTRDDIFTGMTDDTGIARFDQDLEHGLVIITAEAEGVFGIWHAHGRGELAPQTMTYLYTDRDIYRPGEIVHYRGIVRTGVDLDYAIPADVDTVYATVEGYRCNANRCEHENLYESERELTDMGTFSDSFILPDDLAPRDYRLRINTCPPTETCDRSWSQYHDFQVAEFRVPEYTVELTPQYDEILSYDPINVDVFASYYFGGAVHNAQFTRYAWGTSTPFQYRGNETGYTFGDWQASGNASIYEPDQYLTVQSDGHYLLTDTPTAGGSLPVRLNVEATVLDETGQSITGKTTILIHPANLYIGLRPSEMVTDKDVALDIISIFPDSTPRPNQSITLDIVEHRTIRREVSFGRYRWELQTIPISTEIIETDASGQAAYVFSPPNPGRYAFTTHTTDERGRRAQTTVYVTVSDDHTEINLGELGDGFTHDSCESGQPILRLRVISDAEDYVPGDTAILHFQNPYGIPVQALITVERATIRQEEIVVVEPGIYRYELPLTGDDAPNIFFNVILIRPATFESDLPQYLRGGLTLDVDNVERRLNVAVTPSQYEVAPGQSVSFDLAVTNYQGEPVVAEIGTALTDEAIFALRTRNFPSMENHFYPFQQLRVGVTTSGLGLLESVPTELASICGRGGGAGRGEVPTVRDDFIITPLWEPHIMTDENGRATVSVQMPDNTTEWRFDARAVTADTQVGEVREHIVTTLPLMVRAVAPRFFVAGDYLPLAAVVHNNTDQPMQVQVELKQTGLTLDTGTNELQTIDLAPHSLQRVEWWGTVDDVDGIYMETHAISNVGLSDASIPTLTTGEGSTIPVHDFAATDTVASSGILQESGSITEQIDLSFEPDPQDGQFIVSIESNLVNGLLVSVEDLTVTPELSNPYRANYLRMFVALTNTDLLDTTTQQAFHEHIDALISQLIEHQELDGGWGWYPKYDASSSITAAVLISFAEAGRAGWHIDTTALQAGLDYLENTVTYPSTNTESTQLNEQATIAYALALHNRIDTASLDVLYDYYLEMSVTARSHLLLAYLALDPDSEQVATLSSDLVSLAILSGTGTHWEEVHDIQSHMRRNRATTANALLALVRAQPSSPLAPNAIRWLLTSRGNVVGTTLTETTLTVVAVGEWSQQVGNAPPAYDYTVTVNDDLYLESDGSVATDDNEATIHLDFHEMIPDQVNSLTIERGDGDGVLYYTAQLQVTYPADQVDAVEQGVRIDRQYINHATDQPTQSAQIGDIVMVHLNVYVMEDMYYVTLEDILPAGLEPLDWSLDTVTRQANRPVLHSYYYNNSRWSWRTVYWSSQEIHDDGSTLRSPYLPRGVYAYTYPARATTPGMFLVPPTHIVAMEQPEVFGRTRASHFTITDR